MIRAAIYARFSPGKDQREESITAQVRACTLYAKNEGMVIVKLYKDEAKTGKNANREDFQRMIRESKMGLFDILLIDKQDRFARSRYDFAIYKRQLKLSGVQVISVKQPLDPTRPETIILESGLEAYAEYYSRNLATETLKGLKENAYKAIFTGGTPCLGYDIDPQTKRYVINEREADAIRLIFELTLKGRGYRKIQQELNRLGYRTKKGLPFGKNALHEIMRNEKYAGIFIYNQIAAASEDGRRNSHLRKDPSEVIRVPGGCPAIVEESDWKKVQEIMNNRKRRPWSHPKAKERYLLTGKVLCGQCGGAMVGASSYARGQRYAYYACNKSLRTQSCFSRKIRQEELECYVLDQLQQLFAPENIPNIVKVLRNYQRDLNSRVINEERHAKVELKEVNSQIFNLVDILAKQGRTMFDSIKDRLGDLENKKAGLETRLAELEFEAPLGQISEDFIRQFVEAAAGSLNAKDPDQLHEIIHTYVDKITVFPDRVSVELALDCVHTDGAVGAYRIVCTQERALSQKDLKLYIKPSAKAQPEAPLRKP